ncbi:MAG: thioesterase family protein [Deltaproteobacteria bacterium]|nr:thioesterase family protein [Deltaproteobacteria bacterium]
MQDVIGRWAALEKVDASRWRGRIDPSWHQGKGAFGGLGAALLLSTMQDTLADAERIPRSLTVHFCAPCAGDFELTAEVVRRGGRVAHGAARITNGEGAARVVTTMATASFCKDRPDDVRHVAAEMPRVPPPSELHDVPEGVPGLPTFFHHTNVRFVTDVLPFTGASEARVAAWVRMREPEVVVDAPIAAMLLDTLPPALMSTFRAPRAVASVDFTVHFFEALGAPERANASKATREGDAYHLVAIRSRWAAGGYAEELRDLWSPEGVLLAQCRQLLALL